MRSGLGFGASRVLASAVQALTLVLAARGLGPGDFAILAAVVGVLQISQAVFDGGCTTGVAKFHGSPEVVARILVLGRYLSVVGAVVVAAGILLAAALASMPSLTSLLPLAIWLATERTSEVASIYLVGVGRTTQVAIWLVGRRVGVLLACTGALLTNESVLLAFSLGSAASGALAAVGLSWATKRALAIDRGRSDPAPDLAVGPQARNNLQRELVGFWATSIAQQLRALDLIVLSLVAGPIAAMAFAPASRLIPPLRLIPTTYAQVLLARLSRHRRNLTRAEFFWPVAVTAASCTLLALTASAWVPVALGSGYASAVLPLQISILSVPLGAVASLMTSVAQHRGRRGRAAVSAWAGGLATLLLIAIMSFYFGATGAAVASAGGFAVQIGVLGARHRPTEEEIAINVSKEACR